jgi:hypothetical protein
MFLFTDNPTPEPAAAAAPMRAAPVSRAIKDAASETGVSFDYLLRTASRESSLNPEAEARSSSASGLFQFVEQTWLGLVKSEGPRLGLTNASAHINEVSPGRYTVADPAARQAILDLRKDPDISSRMAAVFTSRNREQLSRSIGREPNAGELYIAHFLGASGGGGLIRLASTSPDASAAQYFPDAAAANRAIFYDNGRARSAGEVYASLVSAHGSNASASLPPLSQAYAGDSDGVDMNANGTWSGFRSKPGEARGLFDLYRSDGAPVSDAVERVWTRRANDGGQQGEFALRPALPVEVMAHAGKPIDITPRRLTAGEAKPMPIDDAEPAARPKDKRAATGEPLDLMKFMRLKG